MDNVTGARTIVYGLGRVFAKRYAQIHADYNVVGYCDNDGVSRGRFAHSLAPEELRDQAASYDLILVTPGQGFAIAKDLVMKHGVDSSKIRLLHQPVPFQTANGKRIASLPDVVLHGQYLEDLAILYLCKKLGLGYKQLSYWEAGLSHIIKGSATYCLYREGARGVLLLQPYADYEEQARVYRPADRVVALSGSTAAEMLAHEDRADVLALHEGCSDKAWREVIYAKKPRILAMIARENSLVHEIIAHGYTWFTSLQGTCAVFYRLREET